MVMRSVWQSSLVLLFTFHCASAATNPNCPAGWESDTALNKNCYKPYSTLVTWIDAEFQCRIDSNLKGHLASIHSAFEQNYLLGIAHNNALQGGYMWIGLNSLNGPHPQNFTWIDGSRVDYTNWGPGEPDNSAYELGVCMGIMDHGDSSKWFFDLIHRSQRPFICQISN